MAKPKIGWTKKGDEYRIVGGQSYVKEDGCYQITLRRVDRTYEVWKISAEVLGVDELMRRLEGPFRIGEKGPFGRKFLEKHGEPVSQRRSPPSY